MKYKISKIITIEIESVDIISAIGDAAKVFDNYEGSARKDIKYSIESQT